MNNSELLISIPCKVGDLVHYFDYHTEKEGRKNVTKTKIVTGVVDQIILGEIMIPILNVCDRENNWILINSKEDIGDWAFLSMEEALTKLNVQDVL